MGAAHVVSLSVQSFGVSLAHHFAISEGRRWLECFVRSFARRAAEQCQASCSPAVLDHGPKLYRIGSIEREAVRARCKA